MEGIICGVTSPRLDTGRPAHLAERWTQTKHTPLLTAPGGLQMESNGL